MKNQFTFCFLAILLTINSQFTGYDISHKNGYAWMGSVPHNKWVFEKASGGNNFYNIREVNSGKYLFAVTDGGTGIMLKVRDIKEGSLSGKWELEHVSGLYYRIKNKYRKTYLQNPNRSLSIGNLSNKNAKYGT